MILSVPTPSRARARQSSCTRSDKAFASTDFIKLSSSAEPNADRTDDSRMRCAPVRGWSERVEWVPTFSRTYARRTTTTGSYAFFCPPRISAAAADGRTEVEERRYSRAAEGRCSLARSSDPHRALPPLPTPPLPLLLHLVFASSVGRSSLVQFLRFIVSERRLRRGKDCPGGGGRRNLARSRLTPFFLSPQRSPRRKC